LDPRQLRYFIAIAEYGSFQEAARRIYVAQPALSRQIKALEEEVGVTLLFRHSRGISLSNAGRVFLDDARAFLKQLEGVQERVRRAAEGKVGLLRGDCNETVGRHPLFQALFAAARTRLPGTRIHLSERGSEAQRQRLTQRLTDFAMCFDHGDERQTFESPEELASLCLGEDSFVLYLHKGNPLSDLAVIKLADLCNEPMVLSSRRSHERLYDWIMGASLKQGVALKAEHEADTETAGLALVGAKLGSAILPASLPLERYPDLHRRYIENLALPVRLQLHWRSDGISPTLQRFLDLAGEVLIAA
jgi:DNA-binding transcriptional LysR family regulator